MKKENNQMDKNQILNEIFSNDIMWLLDIKAKSPIINSDDRLITSFEEINSFYDINKREPEKTSWNERSLSVRLQGIRENQEKVEFLKKYDKYNLLKSTKEEIEINSIDDIFNSDSLGLFEKTEKSSDIFTLVNVPEINRDRADADFVARRKLCSNFYKYEEGFKKCQEDLKEWKRVLNIFQIKSQIKEWSYFILNGVLLFIDKIWKLKSDNHGNMDWRLHCIFENGTESNMLLMSLWRALIQDKNWKIVSESIDITMNRLYMINEDDNESGYIYILKSLSTDDKITTKKDLYKIGFSSTTVEERIKNALKDPTYLMAPVKIMSAYKCFNMNPQKLEQLIHNFFWKVCLNIDIFDNKWDRYIPREWFIVPLNVIEETINLIINWNIVNYKYDDENEMIVER